MKQVLQHARTGEIAVEEVPPPQLLPGCVLVRIAASAVSAGTERASLDFATKSLLQKAKSRPDLVREVIQKIQRDGIFSTVQTVRSRLDQPQTPGYSSAGTVIAVGEGVVDLQPGDHVACAGAGIAVHAEIACVPRLLVARIPHSESRDSVPFDQAAFATLGAVALHGVRIAESKLGDIVAVIGLGLIGQLTVQLLKAAGCRVLGFDINRSRAQLAHEWGADAISNSEAEFRELCVEQTRGAGVDSVLIAAETSSSDPVNLAGSIARDRGIVVAVGTVGLQIERKAFYEKELDFRISRSYGPGRYDAAYEQKGRDYPIGYVRWTEARNMEAFLHLLAEGKVHVAPMITHRFPIERARDAYELVRGRSGETFLGIVLQYPGTSDEKSTLKLVLHAPRSTEDTSKETVSIGVLGAGLFATGTLIPAIKASSDTTLMGVCAATGVRAQYAARKFGFRFSTTDDEELISSSHLNTVAIATRHHLHAGQVQRGLRAGKNVFCEKPLCLTEGELAAIVRAREVSSTAKKTQLMVGFNRRFAPMTVQLKSFLAPMAEPLVLQYRINAGYISADNWVNDPEQGGGRILGEVCHFVDLLMFLAESPIVEVEGRCLQNAGRYSGDNVLIWLRFANGSEGTISYLANGDRAFSKERLEVFGGGASAVLEDFRRLETVRDGHKRIVRSRWRQDKGHRAEWIAFAQSIRGEREAPIPFEDLVCSTLATVRVQESIATGKRISVDAPAFIQSAREASGVNE